MRHKGVAWRVWSTCERCTFQYPLEMLVVQKGLRVCTLYCLDNLDIEYRPLIIAEVLGSDDEEKVPQTPNVYENPEELYF